MGRHGPQRRLVLFEKHSWGTGKTCLGTQVGADGNCPGAALPDLGPRAPVDEQLVQQRAQLAL
eukprot:1239316-Alexandrium_andersonii.AAC.1